MCPYISGFHQLSINCADSIESRFQAHILLGNCQAKYSLGAKSEINALYVFVMIILLPKALCGSFANIGRR